MWSFIERIKIDLKLIGKKLIFNSTETEGGGAKLIINWQVGAKLIWNCGCKIDAHYTFNLSGHFTSTPMNDTAQTDRVTKWSVIAIITIIHNWCVHGHARSAVGLYWVAYYIPAGASDPKNEIKWNLLVIAKDRTFLIQHMQQPTLHS